MSSFHLNPVVQIVLVGSVDKGSASFDEAWHRPDHHREGALQIKMELMPLWQAGCCSCLRGRWMWRLRWGRGRGRVWCYRGRGPPPHSAWSKPGGSWVRLMKMKKKQEGVKWLVQTLSPGKTCSMPPICTKKLFSDWTFYAFWESFSKMNIAFWNLVDAYHMQDRSPTPGSCQILWEKSFLQLWICRWPSLKSNNHFNLFSWRQPNW